MRRVPSAATPLFLASRTRPGEGRPSGRFGRGRRRSHRFTEGSRGGARGHLYRGRFWSFADLNQAIIRAHREGLLASASLMVAGDAVGEAVALARRTPTLAVGLHLVVAGGRAVLPPHEIPHVVDAQGRFPESAFRAGLLYALSRAARDELAREMEAQFQRFAATGLRLTHVDGHMHLHLHPVVLDLLLPLAEKYGAAGFRLPRDDLPLSLGHSRRLFGMKLLWALVFTWLTRRAVRVMARRRTRLAVTARVFGLMETGRMTESYVEKALARMVSGPVDSAEFYFHPDTGPRLDDLGPNPGDLETLLSPAIRRFVQERGLRPATYATLRGDG